MVYIFYTYKIIYLIIIFEFSNITFCLISCLLNYYCIIILLYLLLEKIVSFGFSNYAYVL
jgi:hypothetical protein